MTSACNWQICKNLPSTIVWCFENFFFDNLWWLCVWLCHFLSTHIFFEFIYGRIALLIILTIFFFFIWMINLLYFFLFNFSFSPHTLSLSYKWWAYTHRAYFFQLHHLHLHQDFFFESILMMIQLIFSVSSSSTHIIKNHKVNFVVLCLFVCLFLFLLCKFFFLYFFPVPIIFFCCIKSPIPILCNTFAFAFQIMNLQHITTIQSPRLNEKWSCNQIRWEKEYFSHNSENLEEPTFLFNQVLLLLFPFNFTFPRYNSSL